METTTTAKTRSWIIQSSLPGVNLEQLCSAPGSMFCSYSVSWTALCLSAVLMVCSTNRYCGTLCQNQRRCDIRYQLCRYHSSSRYIVLRHRRNRPQNWWSIRWSTQRNFRKCYWTHCVHHCAGERRISGGPVEHSRQCSREHPSGDIGYIADFHHSCWFCVFVQMVGWVAWVDLPEDAWYLVSK